jgi:ankyrin repeat protein
MPERQFPTRPSLRRLKREAKALLHALHSAEPSALADLERYHPESVGSSEAKLADAQLVLARSYGFPSWPRLVQACRASERPKESAMIKPQELDAEAGYDTWDTITAAAGGDTAALRRLIRRNPNFSRAEYWYTPAIHFAVREGHAEAVRLLLDAGADPEWNGYHDGSLIEMARYRGHERIARLLEDARQRMGRVAPGEDHPIHRAAQFDDVEHVRELLDVDPSLLERGDRGGGSPLHRAVVGSARRVVALLLDRGANVHSFHSTSRGGHGGWWSTRVQAIDLAIWGWNLLAQSRGDFETARLLLARGAECDLTVASALGDIDRVTAILHDAPDAIRRARANGRRPLTAAVEFGHVAVVRLLLDLGADPTWPEHGADRGASLRIAVERDRAMVELLLAHGADPNSGIDSGGSATYAASPELRPLLMAHGGTLNPEYAVWLDDDDEVIRRAEEDPTSIDGGVFTTVVTKGKRALLQRLFDLGAHVPPVLTGCQSYLLEHPDMLRTLLAHGMSPDLMNWQHQTLLHLACRGGDVERAAILLDAGASISARDDEYRSTPLAWAARTNAVPMVNFLLARGAPTQLPDDEPWATPLAWAERRQHAEVAALLRRHGAER